MSVVADDAPSMQVALRSAAEDADVVLITTGISVGDEEHVRDALQALGGDLAVLKVAMKPGKPLVAGPVRRRGLRHAPKSRARRIHRYEMPTFGRSAPDRMARAG